MSDEKPPRMRWEYRAAECLDHKLLLVECATLGADGWEMIGMQPVHGFLVGFFRRECRDDEPAAAQISEPTVERADDGPRSVFADG